LTKRSGFGSPDLVPDLAINTAQIIAGPFPFFGSSVEDGQGWFMVFPVKSDQFSPITTPRAVLYAVISFLF